MKFLKLNRQKSGQPILADDMAATTEAAEWASRIQAEPPIEIQNSGFGPIFRMAGMPFDVYIALTDGVVSARSGTSPGTGQASLQWFDGTDFIDSGIDFDVLNYSATPTAGIPDGKYCVILQIAGAYFIVSAEC